MHGNTNEAKEANPFIAMTDERFHRMCICLQSDIHLKATSTKTKQML